jgi:hypothetical protein
MSSTAPSGFDDIHRILGAAMRAVGDARLWPARPHLGGPLPVLSARTQVEVGLAVLERARPLASAGEHAALDQLAARARATAERERDERFTPDHKDHRDELDRISRSSRRDPIAIRVAKGIVRAGMNHLYSAPSARNAAGTCVENAAVALVEHLVASASGHARNFLAELDGAILRSELAAQLAARDLAVTHAIARVVSRPRGPGGRGLGLVLAQLADGSFGLYVKLRQRWEWHEGDRATVFATVPDSYMEHVIADLDG